MITPVRSKLTSANAIQWLPGWESSFRDISNALNASKLPWYVKEENIHYYSDVSLLTIKPYDWLIIENYNNETWRYCNMPAAHYPFYYEAL